jgi:ribonuclease T2
MRKLTVVVAIFVVLASAAMAGPPLKGWVLALSWSPAWCNGKGGDTDPDQCGRGKHFGFVVHGLWPQFADDARPEHCPAGSGVPGDVAERMMAIMPSHQLIDHEWAKHGACTGLEPADYFERTSHAFDLIHLPDVFKSGHSSQKLTPAGIRQLFTDANPRLPADAFTLGCRGEWLNEVRFCLDGRMRLRSCDDDRDHCPAQVRMEALMP